MLLGIIIVIVVAYLAAKAIEDARSRSWTGPRTKGMKSRAAAPRRAPSGSGSARAKAKADAFLVWEKARAAIWQAQQQHAIKNGAAPAPAAAAAKPALVQRLRLRPQAAATQPSAAANGTGASPARQSPPPPPAPPAAPPAANPSVPSSNGGTVATSTGAEQLIEGVNRIHAEAAAGGIHHKQAALKAANEGSIRFSAMAQMLARTMSEPGNNYGPEITEPLGKAAQHLQAAAMSFGEADTNLTTLIHMSVGELAASPRQAPHHSELSENGSGGAYAHASVWNAQ